MKINFNPKLPLIDTAALEYSDFKLKFDNLNQDYYANIDINANIRLTIKLNWYRPRDFEPSSYSLSFTGDLSSSEDLIERLIYNNQDDFLDFIKNDSELLNSCTSELNKLAAKLQEINSLSDDSPWWRTISSEKKK